MRKVILKATNPSAILRFLAWRLFDRGLYRYSAALWGLAKTIRMPLNDANLPFYRLLAIGLRRCDKHREAAEIMTKLVSFGIPDRYVPSAIFIFISAGAIDTAKELIVTRGGDSLRRTLLRMFLLQADNQLGQAEQCFNEYLKASDLVGSTGLSKGMSHISFETSEAPTVIVPVGGPPRPLVSIIMTVFNDVAFLERAINSLRNQTVQDFELLIVDDASSDQTFALATELAAEDKRISVFRNDKNYGPYYSKNSVLSRATGQYLAFHDADDISHPQRLELQIESILKGSTSGVFGSMCYHVRVCERTGELIERGFHLLTESPISLIVPRDEFITTFGAFDSVRAGGDSELIKRIQAYLGGQAITLVEQPLYLASYRSGSLTTDNVLGLTTNHKYSVRERYRREFAKFHNRITAGKVSPHLAFPPTTKHYHTPKENRVEFPVTSA